MKSTANAIKPYFHKRLTLCYTSTYGVEEAYDSSGDYWKLMEDGSVVFDGNKDLVDEDGNVLKKYEGDGGYTDSLKEVLGISEAQAETMLVNAGLTYRDGTFKTSADIDAKNNSDIRLHAPKDDTQRLIDTYGNSAWMAQNSYYAGVVEGYKQSSAEQERKQWERAHPDEVSRFDKDNPQAKELLKQTDQFLKTNRPVIAESGCVFRTIQAVCEIASGMTLNGQQIIDIWDAAIKGNALWETGEVQEYSTIASLTLDKLGVKGYGFEFRTNTNNGRLVGYMGTMPYSSKDTHKAFYLDLESSGNPLYNPGVTNNEVFKWDPIYMYPR